MSAHLSVCLPTGLTVSVCPVRSQRLKEVLHLHEFRRESSELEDWIKQQRHTAESQELGNDYQHVQVTARPPEGAVGVHTVRSSSPCAASSPVHVVCICVTFQLLCGKFEGFLKHLEVGEERLRSCGALAAQLLSGKHPQSSAVREMLQQLRCVLVVLHVSSEEC